MLVLVLFLALIIVVVAEVLVVAVDGAAHGRSSGPVWGHLPPCLNSLLLRPLESQPTGGGRDLNDSLLQGYIYCVCGSQQVRHEI